MKRSRYLVPLSWEHHNALLNANRLQKGLANNTETKILLEFTNFVWQNDLLPHFKREEDIIINNAEWTKVSEILRKQILAEHQSISDLVKELNISTNENEIRDVFNEFANKIINHVRFEERELFPAVEEKFSEQNLKKIEQALREAHVPGCTTWNPKFWEKK